MSDYKCNWCGKGASRGTDYDGTPSGWVWNKSYGTGRKVFCSNKCLNEFNAQNSSSSSQKDSSASSDKSKKVHKEKRPKTEAEIAYEIDRKRKLDEKRDEQERKEEGRKEEKILKYKAEGKKFLLFTVEKPILTFFLFFILFPALFFFIGGITFGPGIHMLLFPVLPMIGFTIMYLRDSMKK